MAELLGTALLLYVVVGSGIAAETLGTDAAGQLFAHAVTVGVGLAALIAWLAPVSGAHLNPSVTLAFRRQGDMTSRETVTYVTFQVVGAWIGVVVANATFGQPMIAIAGTARDGPGRVISEFVATFVLVALILGLVRTGRHSAVPAAVGAWVTTIIFATTSTDFANPAVTVGRMVTDTFTGVAPASAPGFILAQLIGGLAAVPATRYLIPTNERIHEEDHL